VSKGSYKIRSVIVVKFNPIGGAMKQLYGGQTAQTHSFAIFPQHIAISSEERASVWDAKVA
jgi:hypothetical protein